MENISRRIMNLQSEVVDQIAAGEVVEKPAQMVKELVENSLDAGATKISVEFSEGGRFVQISDNGRGIHPEDLSKALDRFTTSKIVVSEDLWRLQTYGFRGEALSSIASVSKLTLHSRATGSSEGYQLTSEFGKKSNLNSVARDFGTTIRVEELFSNIPARLKFLKSAAAEATHIKNVLRALAFAFHEVEFRITSNQELLFFWPAAESRFKRVQQVLGLEKVYEGFAQREYVKAYSVFTDPATVAKTSRNIWTLVQNRWVTDRGLQAGVTEAYRNLLMHGEYPFSVTWIETEADKIDVNIHPSKAQVKFADASLAFRAVQASVRDVLEKSPWLVSSPSVAPIETSSPKLETSAYFTNYQPETFFKQKISIQDLRIASLRPEVASIASSSDSEASPNHWRSKQVLAQAHLTYIVTQSNEGVCFIDQHAAHERILFEKLLASYTSGQTEVQDFLFPLAVDLSPDQVEALLNYRAEFEKFGLSFDSLGPSTLGVRSAPTYIKEKGIADALHVTAEEICSQGGSFRFERYVKEFISRMACHSAIRAGQALSLEEMRALLVQMDEFPLSSFCPHGRPVSVDYPLYELERDFGRIV
jgi:DNA mismatch repair protein MutL